MSDPISEILADAEHGIVQTLSQWTTMLRSWNADVSGQTTHMFPTKLSPEDELPNKITPVSAKDVYAALGRADLRLKYQSILVLLAQWSLETGGGAAVHCYNLGNAKHLRGDAHMWTMFGCTEVISGRVVRFEPPDPQTWFRAFRTLDDGAADYLAMLKTRFAGAWSAVEAGDVASFGHLLKQERYYTADEHAYVALMSRLYAELERQVQAPTESPIPDLTIQSPSKVLS